MYRASCKSTTERLGRSVNNPQFGVEMRLGVEVRRLSGGARDLAATLPCHRHPLHDRIGVPTIVQQDGPRLDAVARANLCGLAAAQRKSA